MDAPTVTNVLICKDGYFYLSREINVPVLDERGEYTGETYTGYQIIEELPFNGFETIQDAYSYYAHLRGGV